MNTQSKITKQLNLWYKRNKETIDNLNLETKILLQQRLDVLMIDCLKKDKTLTFKELNELLKPYLSPVVNNEMEKGE